MPAPTPPLSSPDKPQPGRNWAVAAVPGALFLIAVVPAILWTKRTGYYTYDHAQWHEPTIRTFASDLFHPPLADYGSATTPGYHLLLAAICRWVTPDTTQLQLAAALFGVALLITLARACGAIARGPWYIPLLLALPLACSKYVFQAGMWLLPDNAGWLGVLTVLLIALRASAASPPRAIAAAAGGAALLALVLVRQIHLWTAAPLWAAAWAAASPPAGDNERADPYWAFRNLPARTRAVLPAFAATLPAIAAVAWFVHLWQGLTPPTFRNQYPRGNPAAPVFLVALIGAVSPFFIGYLWVGLVDLWRNRRPAALITACLGLVLSLISPTTRQQSEGRWGGGLWDVTRFFPSVAERSVIISILAVAGAVAIAGWSRVLTPGPRLVLLAAILAFATAQTASFEVYQRYNEPLVLLLLALLAAAASRADTDPSRARAVARVLGPLALASLLAAVTAISIFR